ncbi:hypothetical protein [Hymenobacter siberiensis]|uniref:hypothetical protein n=1 Tax=Hymenobacter siberiensis TaxID=2848396 RepID=UPI001C1DFFBF|nr:hypothetical protein [Hymenobacter siberiensis]
MRSFPEPSYREELQAILSESVQLREDMVALVLRNADGTVQAVASLAACWQSVPGREGVRLYHIPHPDRPGLHATMFIAAPHSHYQSSIIDQSRLVGITEGEINVNGRDYFPGNFFWLGPGCSTSWATTELGAAGIVQYNTPMPDIDIANLFPFPNPNL